MEKLHLYNRNTVKYNPNKGSRTARRLQFIRKTMMLIAVMLLSMIFGKAQPIVQWANTHNETFGSGPSNAEDWMMNIISTQDGGYLGVGFTWTGSDGSGDCDDPNTVPPTACDQNNARTPLIVKTDNAGNVIATYKPGNSSGTCPNGMAQYVAWGVVEVNSGYVICAYMHSTSNSHTKVYIAQLNKSNLSVISDAYINDGDGNNYVPYSLKVVYNGTTEDGFVLAGHADVSGNPYGYILRLSTSFTKLWEYFDATAGTQFYSVTPIYQYGMNPDGTPKSSGSVTGFAATGENVVGYDRDVYVAATDAGGSFAWYTYMYPSYGSGTETCNYVNSYTSSSLPTATRLPDPSINCANTTGTYGHIDTWHGDNTQTSHSYCISQISDGNLVIAGEFDDEEGDCSDPSVYPYFCFSDEYRSAESILFKIGGTDGVPISFIPYNVGGGGDFREKFKERSDGDFVAISNTSNYNPYVSEVQLADPSNDMAEVVLFRIASDLSSVVWYVSVPSAVTTGDDCSCAFALDLTNDGGYIVGGNNGTNNDDMIFVKFGGECQNPTSYPYYSLPSTGTYDASTDGSYTSFLSTGAPVSGSWDITGNVTMTGYTFNFFDTKLQNNFYNPTAWVTNLTIEPGGSLTLIGCTLQGYTACDGNAMWDGIIVKGNPGLFQSPSTNQGELILEGTTIEHARTGVAVGTDITNGGGILTAEDDPSTSAHTYFTNNWVGVNFAPYGGSNISTIKNCTFDWSNTSGYAALGASNAHVELSGVSGVTITGNTFNNTAAIPCNSQLYGILAVSSDLSINDPSSVYPAYSTASTGCLWTGGVSGYKNYFNDLDYGIWTDADGSHNTSIWLCQFNDVKEAISVTGESGNSPTIGLNYFHYTDALQSSTDGCNVNYPTYTGVHIMNCPTFTVTNNKLSIDASISHFYDINGIWISSSGTGTGPSLIYYNQFRNQTPLLASVVYGTLGGAWSTGIRIDDFADLGPKNIVINHNGEDNPGTGTLAANSNLANYYDLYIDDNGFTQTPPGSLAVGNFFTTSGSASSKEIYSTNGFIYYHATSTTCTNPGNVNSNVTVDITRPTDYNTTYPQTDYCMGTDLMPTAPEVRNNNQFGDNAMENGQSLFGAINQENPAMSIDIFPNPFSNSADIRYSIPPGFGSASMMIIDGIGKQVEILQLSNGQHDLVLNNYGLRPGIYYYNVTAQNEKTLNGKFVVTKQ